MAMNPMAQFAVKPLVPLHIGHYDVSFTNQSLWMFIVVGAVSLFLYIAATSRSLVPTRTQSIAELSYEFVASMIQSAAGEEGLKFFPFVFTIFIVDYHQNPAGADLFDRFRHRDEGHTLCSHSIALRTMLSGGAPCCRNLSWKSLRLY